jgi:Cytochrome c
MGRRALDALCIIAMLSALHFASATTLAQTASKPALATVARGKASFHERCAVCHGEQGKGNGPAAGALTPRPTNLTVLARQKGTFPAAHVEASIKGTDPVVAHGIPGMMVWGALLLADANGNQAKADAAIGDLVKYVESIQVR